VLSCGKFNKLLVKSALHRKVKFAILKIMTKTEVINMFGGKRVNVSKAINRTKALISQWPENLTEDQINMVVGAAYRLGKTIPDSVKIQEQESNHGQTEKSRE
jgi:hypothetical protein